MWTGASSWQQAAPGSERLDGRSQHSLCKRRERGRHPDVYGDHKTGYEVGLRDLTGIYSLVVCVDTNFGLSVCQLVFKHYEKLKTKSLLPLSLSSSGIWAFLHVGYDLWGWRGHEQSAAVWPDRRPPQPLGLRGVDQTGWNVSGAGQHPASHHLLQQRSVWHGPARITSHWNFTSVYCLLVGLLNNTVPTCCVKVDVHYCRASTSIPWSYSYIYAAVISPVISSVCSWGDCCSIFKTLRLDLLSGINWLKAAVGRAMQSNKSPEGLRNELIKVTHIKCVCLYSFWSNSTRTMDFLM